MMLGKVDIHMGGKKKLYPYLTPYININSKWIRDLNLRVKTIKLFEGEVNLHRGEPSWSLT